MKEVALHFVAAIVTTGLAGPDELELTVGLQMLV